MCLELQPVARASSHRVAGVEALGDDPLELLLLRRRQQRVAVVERFGKTHVSVPLVEKLHQPFAALDEWQVDERFALDLDHVKRVVDDRRSRFTLLHRREARAPSFVERAHLAVEHAVRRLHRFYDMWHECERADLGV